MQSHWFRPNPKMSNATIGDVCRRFVSLWEDVMGVDNGGVRLGYSEELTPTPYDDEGMVRGGTGGGSGDGWARLAREMGREMRRGGG